MMISLSPRPSSDPPTGAGAIASYRTPVRRRLASGGYVTHHSLVNPDPAHRRDRVEIGLAPAAFIIRRHDRSRELMVITDYDTPRRASVDVGGDGLEDLGGRRVVRSGGADVDDSDGEGYEPPGVDPSGEELTAAVVPMLHDEFRCTRCFLIRHHSQRATPHEDICRDCA